MASDQARQNSLVVLTITLTVISFVVVAIRIVIRACVIRKPGFDDWLICVSLLCAIAYMVEVLIGRSNGMGFPMTTLSLQNMVNLMKVTLAIQATYYIAVSSIKISILLMYLRFAVDYTFRKIVIWTAAFHSVFLTVCIIVVFTQCQPISKFWDLAQSAKGVCTINTTAFFYFTSAFNILTDIFILALPVKTLLSINRPTRERVALLGIFLVGTFATVTSIIRLHTIYDYTLADDPFRHSILVNVWSVIEINLGIICASVPALKPLFSPKALREATSRYKKSNGSGSHSGTTSRYGIFSRSHGQEKIEGSGHVDTVVEAGSESWDMATLPSQRGIEVRTHFEMTDRTRDKDPEASSQEGIVVRN